MRVFLLLSAIMLITSCNNGRDTPDGGPCSYSDATYPARLIKTIPLNSEEYDAVFVLEGVKSFHGDDTVYYSRLNNQHYIQKHEMLMDSMLPGKKYAYIVKNIISGSCNPHIEWLKLEPCPGK